MLSLCLAVRSLSGRLLPQWWCINGGPGTPGLWLLPFVAVPSSHPLIEAEFLLPDHRGTGLSHELACPDGSQDLSEDCVAALKQDPTELQHFTISNAARDLYTGIQQLRTSAPVFVLGTSYGTLVVNRFMTMYPKAKVTGVVLDSVVNPLEPNFAQYDADASEVGEQFVALCDENPVCRRVWAPLSAIKAFKATVSEISNGTQVWCAGSLSASVSLSLALLFPSSPHPSYMGSKRNERADHRADVGWRRSPLCSLAAYPSPQPPGTKKRNWRFWREHCH